VVKYRDLYEENGRYIFKFSLLRDGSYVEQEDLLELAAISQEALANYIEPSENQDVLFSF